MAPAMAAVPRRARGPLALAAACCAAIVAATAAASWAEQAPSAFVAGRPAAQAPRSGLVAMRASGALRPDSVQKRLPKGFKRQLMKRMPDSTLTTEQMMQRITTVLIKNIDENWRDAPMKTLDLMKEIGLRGRQIKEKKYINDALYMLMGQKVVHKVKQNPIRWEIHESFRELGVPPVSGDKRRPWKLTHILKFDKTRVPKYGPIHGRPMDA
mmetsp:Transcript_34761/g.75900  ORF Transcript_34761/g.75900 Transcript_34761/m.75900 type:complete len:212 (+) Transcript_34761:49-684(+)